MDMYIDLTLYPVLVPQKRRLSPVLFSRDRKNGGNVNFETTNMRYRWRDAVRAKMAPNTKKSFHPVLRYVQLRL
jgi:hypothetical protein